MGFDSTVFTDPSLPNDNLADTKCPHCEHIFSRGNLSGEIFCVSCGKQFDSTEHSPLQASSSDPDQITPPLSTSISSTLSTKTFNNKLRAGKVSRFGDYTIIEEVARGGMGIVYKAEHKTLKRIVALKVLKSGDGASEDDVKRFIQEAKAAATLKHPNIVPIHNFDIYRGLHFFTMDYIEGQPLDRVLESGSLPPYKACELITTIAESISYAHNQGVIHRDIKPGNVIIDLEGRPMLTDFGLAINLTSNDEENRMTKSGSIMGTIPYIPPEQASGLVEDIGPRSDVYSLGALFYELITGRPPFHGMTQFELLRRVINHYPVSPKKLMPRLSKDIDTIIMKCLSKEPSRRYQSAKELVDDCEAFLNGNIISARPFSIFYTIRRKIMRRPAISLMVGSLILLSMFALVVVRYARGANQQLIESKAEQAQINKDKNILNAMLKRDWRGEYSVDFTNSPKLTTSIKEAQSNEIGWKDPTQTLLSSEGLKISAAKDSSNVSFAAPVSLPFNFNVNLKISTPNINMGTLKLFIGIDKSFKIKDSTRVIELGVEGNPGARILRAGTALAEDGSFTLRPGEDHNISVYRDIQNQIIVIQVDNNEVIRLTSSSDISTAKDAYIGLAAAGGEYTLKALQISVLGMNQEMIKSSLRLADSLASESKDTQAAKVLYEKVLKERSNRQTILAAYTGYINTLDSKQRNIIYECNSLADSISQSQSRYLEIGEIEYLIGIALANRGIDASIDYFTQSFNHSYRNALKDLTPSSVKVLGPLTNDFQIDPQSLSDPKRPEVGALKWQDLTPNKDHRYTIPLPTDSGNKEGKYLLSESFSLKKETHVIIYLDDDGEKLYINGKEFSKFLEDKGRDRLYAITDLPAGKNTIIIENQKDPQDPSKEPKSILLRVREHNLLYTSVYGLLSRIEGALVLLKRDPDTAFKIITSLQNDHTLEYLKRYYPNELKARGILGSILLATDKMLQNTKVSSNHAWILLEAARTLSDTADGSELAIRYNKLAEMFVKNGNLSQARDLFSQAINLLPDWPTPLLKRAELLYRQENLWYEGVSAFDEALKALPNSLELRLQIASFYLHPGFELSPNPNKKLEPIPERALAVAKEAIILSKRNSPQALTLCAEALELMKKYEEALHYIQEAILLESTPERKALLKKISSEFNSQNTD